VFHNKVFGEKYLDTCWVNYVAELYYLTRNLFIQVTYWCQTVKSMRQWRARHIASGLETRGTHISLIPKLVVDCHSLDRQNECAITTGPALWQPTVGVRSGWSRFTILQFWAPNSTFLSAVYLDLRSENRGNTRTSSIKHIGLALLWK